MPSGADNVLTIHTTDGTERFRIDSSGNVKVGSAATISPDGDLFVTGVCTATTLSGAASGLTGALPAISAANLTNVPAANITGTLPAISAANLTNIPAANVTGTLAAISAANLTNIPAANIVGVCTAGLASASGFLTGLTMVDQWRVTSNFSSADTDLTSNWERNDSSSEVIGDGMTESSGVFTFPSTGKYLIMFHFHGYNSTQTRYVGGQIKFSTDSGGSYTTRAQQYNSVASDVNVYAGGSTTYFVDVTNASTHKVKFNVAAENSITWNASSDSNMNHVTFLRLGDT